MAKRKEVTPPGLPKHIRLAGGRGWTRKEDGVPGYSSDDGVFNILQGNGYVVLVSFEHEANDSESEFWRKRFRTAREAMEYAESM